MLLALQQSCKLVSVFLSVLPRERNNFKHKVAGQNNPRSIFRPFVVRVFKHSFLYATLYFIIRCVCTRQPSSFAVGGRNVPRRQSNCVGGVSDWHFLFLSLLQIVSLSLSATEYQQLLADTYQNISYVGLSTIGSSTVKRMSMLTTILYVSKNRCTRRVCIRLRHVLLCLLNVINLSFLCK